MAIGRDFLKIKLKQKKSHIKICSYNLTKANILNAYIRKGERLELH